VEDIEEPSRGIPVDFGDQFVSRKEFDEFRREHDRIIEAIGKLAERMEGSRNDEHE
jgi:hypothetical protein